MAMAVPDGGPYLVSTAAIAVENTHNFGGGTVQPIERAARRCARATGEAGIAVHLDGARLWNAHVATGVPLAEYGALRRHRLGVPVEGPRRAGRVACWSASAERIAAARVWRKRYGGGMRQVGVLAAAAGYALAHHLTGLADDHARARRLAEAVAGADDRLVRPGEVRDEHRRAGRAAGGAGRERSWRPRRPRPRRARVGAGPAADAAGHAPRRRRRRRRPRRATVLAGTSPERAEPPPRRGARGAAGCRTARVGLMGGCPRVTDPEPEPPRTLPPGQRLADGFPVRHYGPVPKFRPDTWRLTVTGATAAAVSTTSTSRRSRAADARAWSADIHCVTKWTVARQRLGRACSRGRCMARCRRPTASRTSWRGPSTATRRTSTGGLRLAADGARHRPQRPAAHARAHGWPLRLVVPHLYAWKGPKWLRMIEYLDRGPARLLGGARATTASATRGARSGTPTRSERCGAQAVVIVTTVPTGDLLVGAHRLRQHDLEELLPLLLHLQPGRLQLLGGLVQVVPDDRGHLDQLRAGTDRRG